MRIRRPPVEPARPGHRKAAETAATDTAAEPASEVTVKSGGGVVAEDTPSRLPAPIRLGGRRQWITAAAGSAALCAVLAWLLGNGLAQYFEAQGWTTSAPTCSPPWSW